MLLKKIQKLFKTELAVNILDQKLSGWSSVKLEGIYISVSRGGCLTILRPRLTQVVEESSG